MTINSKEKWLILKTVQDKNILPITSICKMSCIFCSHYQNPPDIKTYSYGHLDLDFIRELIEYLPKKGSLIIGESATKIIEGEPLCHPDFKKIIKIIRKKFENKLIKISTNGSLLTTELVKFLKTMQPVKINLSLNCASPEERKFLMNDKNPQQVFKGIEYLCEYKIPFNGSIVAMPHILGWKSFENTVKLLIKYKPETIRIFLPGFTKYSNDEMRFDTTLLNELKDNIKNLNQKYKIPIIMEPPLLNNFICNIKGVIANSPAEKAGLKKFDIIEKINQQKPITRVEAFHKLVKLKSPKIKIRRKDKDLKIQLEKEKNSKPGIVLDYDLSLTVINSIENKINMENYQDILIITSQFSKNLFELIIKNLADKFPEKNIELLAVDNEYFGGSIMCTGLLVNSDIIKAINQNNYENKDLVILPGNIYDEYGKDLKGKSYKKIIKKFNINIELIGQ